MASPNLQSYSRSSEALKWETDQTAPVIGAVFLMLLNDGHSCQHIEGVGWQVEVIQTGRYYSMLSTKCIRKCRLV